LTSFYGISHHMSQRLLARLQIHNEALVSNLTEPQVTALSAYLSSPTTNPSPDLTPVCQPGQQPSSNKGKGRETETRQEDPLDILKIETDLRRSLQSDIAHHRTIGTYRGKRLVLVFDQKTGELHLRLTVNTTIVQTRCQSACPRSTNKNQCEDSQKAQQG
jgi:ribosomal protein S13